MIYQNEVKKYPTYFVVYSRKCEVLYLVVYVPPVPSLLCSGWASITTTAVERLGGV